VEFCGAYSWKLEGLFWNLQVEQSAVYRYLASLVKLFGNAIAVLVLRRSSGARPACWRWRPRHLGLRGSAKKLRRLANPLKDCLGATPRPARKTRLTSATSATIRSTITIPYRCGVGRDRGVGRGRGVTLGAEVGDGVAVAVGVAVGLGIGVGVGVLPGVLKA
jgi:hypothetical protein